MTLTKADISAKVADKLRLHSKLGKALVDSVFSEIADYLANDTEVKLSGFGNFVLLDKKARPGRNPRTNEAVGVSARRVVVFKAGQKFKLMLN